MSALFRLNTQQLKHVTAKTTESNILHSVRQWLKYNGWFVIRIHQSLGCHKGIADLVAIKNGIHLWIEIKTPHGKQSEHQKLFEQDIIQAGGMYVVARSIDDIINIADMVEKKCLQKHTSERRRRKKSIGKEV